MPIQFVRELRNIRNGVMKVLNINVEKCKILII